MQKIALIPAYCPGDRMIGLVRELDDKGFAVIIIDDGSGSEYDAVFDAAQEYADVHRYTPNRGKGEALKYGLRAIQKQYQAPYIIVTADADGQHRVEDVVKVSDTAAAHPDSLVLGKRDLDRSAPLKSRMGNGTTRFFFRLISGRNIYETQTGLRAFSNKLLPRFENLPGHRYEYEIDMILDASDLDIIEVGIQTIYFDNNAETHFHPVKDTLRLNSQFLRYKIPSLIAGAAGYLLFVILALVTGQWLLPCIGARVFTLVIKFILNKVVPFAEKPSVGRFCMTGLIILLCDVLTMWALVAIGVNVYVAKLIAGVVMIAVGNVVRTVYMRVKYR